MIPQARTVNERTFRPKSLAGNIDFLWAGLVKQPQTGAFFPSQRFLIAKMIAPIPETYGGLILELGAGNGSLTLELAERCPQARILACEINPTLALASRRNLLRAGFAHRVEVLSDSAENLLPRLSTLGIKPPEYIVSGIPLGNFGKKRTLALLDLISRAISSEGLYIQFQYSLLDRKKIQARFPNLRIVPVLLNFPPAVVYYARRRN